VHLLFTAFYAFFLHFRYYTPFAHKLLRFPLHIYYILSFAFNSLHFPMNACFQETLLWPWGIRCILGLPHFELPLVWSVAIELCTSSIFIPWRKKTNALLFTSWTSTTLELDPVNGRIPSNLNRFVFLLFCLCYVFWDLAIQKLGFVCVPEPS